MKVAVLGAFGLMAEAALHDLANQRRVDQILACDITLARAKSVLAKIPQRAKVKAVQLDLTDTASAARKLKGCGVVLNCAWYEHNLKAMELALSLNAHYVDLGGLYHMTLKQLRLDARFKRAGRVAVLGCGSTPGITNMMAARMAPSFETIDTVGIYDASYDPSLSEDSFLPPFSIRTMLAEYIQPAPVLRGGRMVAAAAHSEPDELDFKAPIGRVHAGTVIHSETATLPAYLKDKRVKNLFFKIAYPESVKRQLGLLVGMGFARDKETLAYVTRLAQKSALQPAATPRDFEVLRLRVSGARHGRPLLKIWDCEIRPTRLLSAGAIGVGCAGSIAALLACAGKTKIAGGAGAPENTLDEDAFFRELRSRKAFSLIETITHPLTI